MDPKPDAQSQPAPLAERAQRMFQMLVGYRVSAMIIAAAQLGIADLLKNGPQAASELAHATNTHAPSLYRLLRALASVGIFAEDEQGRFALTPLAELLQTGVPGSQRAAALAFSDESQWKPWSEIMYSLRTGETTFQHLYGIDVWEYRGARPELSANFDAFMSARTAPQTLAIVSAYDFSGIGTLADVGGGRGTLMAGILQANPSLRGILCDAPHVVEGAQPVLEAAGVAGRCEIAECDFFSSVPAGADAYILKSVLHDWSDEEALKILKTCRRAVPPHGKLLLVDYVMLPGNDPATYKIMDVQMLVMVGGRERTESEFATLLAEAGFALTRVIPTRAELSIVEAVPR